MRTVDHEADEQGGGQRFDALPGRVQEALAEETLRDTLLRCVEEYGGRPPTVAEFEWWREREVQKAQARGDEDGEHLPSASPYRKRWKTWEKALLHFGFTPEKTSGRFQQR